MFRSTTVNFCAGLILYRDLVARHTGIDGPPLSYVVSGTWPEAELSEPVAVYAQDVARRLKAAVAETGYRSVGRAAGLDHTTVMSVVRGERWPDLITIAKLELALDLRLWPE